MVCMCLCVCVRLCGVCVTLYVCCVYTLNKVQVNLPEKTPEFT